MTGWLLILFLLLLGGILSTLGDRLGSRIGKARLSVFNLRPRATAVLITVLTGSFISAISLSFMLLVSRELRDGLFKLKDLRNELEESRLVLLPLKKERKILEGKINNAEKELRQFESNLIALRKGDVVIKSGQALLVVEVELDDPQDAKKEIENILQKANLYTFIRARPGEKPNRRILLVRRDHIAAIESKIKNQGKWVVIIRSANNILKGENYVQAYPDILPNKNIVKEGEIIASTILQIKDPDYESVTNKIKLLLSSTLAEVKKRGSLSTDLKLNRSQVKNVVNRMLSKKGKRIKLKTSAVSNSDTADKVSISLTLEEMIDSKDDMDF